MSTPSRETRLRQFLFLKCLKCLNMGEFRPAARVADLFLLLSISGLPAAQAESVC